MWVACTATHPAWLLLPPVLPHPPLPAPLLGVVQLAMPVLGEHMVVYSVVGSEKPDGAAMKHGAEPSKTVQRLQSAKREMQERAV